MNSTNCIGQKGIVEDIVEGIARINITTYSACTNCDSKAACLLNETKSTIIEIETSGYTLHKGDVVEVIMQKKLGIQATLLAYFIPFLILLFVLILLSNIGFKESIAGLLAIAILIPYYIILYLFKQNLKEKFKFSLRKES